eukprot:NODE_104_length_19294_cov_0.449179.p10 type:complete len:296 gc:universal NODE_104_length_19294_cov_0.449179:4396-5283(+)
MIFAGDNAGYLYLDFKRLTNCQPSSKCIKIVIQDDMVVFKENSVEIWDNGICSKSCTMDELLIFGDVLEKHIICFFSSRILILNYNLKSIQEILFDLKSFLNFDNGFLYTGRENMSIHKITLKESFCTIEPYFKTKLKKNNASGVDKMIIRDALQFQKNQFVAISANRLYFYDSIFGSRPKKVEVFDVGLVKLKKLAGDDILLIGNDGSILKYNITNRLIVGKFKDTESHSTPLSFSSDNDHLYIGYTDRYVRVFELKNCKLLQKIYLKQKISALFVTKDSGEESEDDIWEELQK